MAGVEAAAALFGSDDSGSDPFASLDGTSQEVTNDLFGTTNDSAPPDFLQQSQSVPESLGHVEQRSPLAQHSDSASTWPQSTVSYSHGSGTGTSGNNQSQGQQAWYGQYGQVNGSERSSSVTGYSSAQPPASYDSYGPPSDYKTPNAALRDYSQSAYSSSASSSYAPPAPAAAAYAAQAPYTPSTQYGTSSYYLKQSTYSQSTVSPYAEQNVAPAPAPTVPLDRPKVSNAYDPPFPMTKHARRAVSRPNVSQNAYITPTAPPLPPPPPRAPSLPPAPRRAPSTSLPPPPPREPSTVLAQPPSRGLSATLPPPPRASSASFSPPPARKPSASFSPPIGLPNSSSPPMKSSTISQLTGSPPLTMSPPAFSLPYAPGTSGYIPGSVSELKSHEHALVIGGDSYESTSVLYPAAWNAATAEEAGSVTLDLTAQLSAGHGPYSEQYSPDAISDFVDPESVNFGTSVPEVPSEEREDNAFNNGWDHSLGTSLTPAESRTTPEEPQPLESMQATKTPSSPSPPNSSTSQTGGINRSPRVSSPLAHSVTSHFSSGPYPSNTSRTSSPVSRIVRSTGTPPISDLFGPTYSPSESHACASPMAVSNHSRADPSTFDTYSPSKKDDRTSSPELCVKTYTPQNEQAKSKPPPLGFAEKLTPEYASPSAPQSFTPYLPGQPGVVSRPVHPSFSAVLPATSSGHPYGSTANGHIIDGLPPKSTYSPPPVSYAPAKPSYAPPPEPIRNRSMSNGSILSVASERSNNPYPIAYTSRYDYTNNDSSNVTPSIVQSVQGLAPPQEIVFKAHTPYAPSPSLLGTNDPLGRTSVRVPVFSFGFGGKMVTCFHGAATLSTGFDVAFSSKNSTGVNIKVIKGVVPQSALASSSAKFPGPLFLDPGTPTTSLVRTGTSAQLKGKKAKLARYLSTREEEISQGISYLNSGSVESHQAEGKLVLVKLLKIMVENDGRLSGTPHIDSAVRSALVPTLGSPNDEPNGVSASGFTSVSDSLHASDSSYTAFSGATLTNETPIAVSTLRSSSLEKIKEFLLRGQRRQAYHYALDEKLWAHAMVIASGIDKDAWQEVVREFLRTELGPVNDPTRAMNSADVPVSGWESLRVAYGLLSGQGSAAVQEMVPQSLLSRASGRLLSLPTNTVALVTPMTPNFAAPPPATNVPAGALAQWPETLAMMLSSPLSPETSAALTSLGDQLLASQWVEAAHACYLLSPQTSHWGGIGHPSARIILLGARSPQVWPAFAKDPDSIILSEIAEFALSLATPAKGQESFQGFPHLQAYRLSRAISLVELGEVTLANRYCEAITSSLGRGSPYYTGTFLDQLKNLSERIVGVSQVDKTGTWIGGKLNKPSLDTIGGWLEGRFTKLVTGDSESETPKDTDPPKADDAGAFSHYSTISSTTTSTSPSPQPSFTNLSMVAPGRTGSAMSTSSYHPPVDYSHHRQSPANHVATGGPFSQSFGQTVSQPVNLTQDTMTPWASHDSAEDDGAQEVTWWGAAGGYNSGSTETPTATTFMKVDQNSSAPSTDGFISLMDSPPFSVTPATPSRSSMQHSPVEEEEDLGFGNPKSKPKNYEENEGSASNSKGSTPSTKAAPERPDPKAVQNANGGSWLSRWWKREGGGPVKASLGEETSFYYDKDLKKWVNKKAGAAEAAKPSPPPPPPSRPQTTSPGFGQRPPSSTGNTPPPPRPASAVDLNSPPSNKPVMRIRSNLAPTPESAPSTPTGSRLAPPAPPPGRPKSQASKRSVRSRYVDVLQEGGGP